MKRLIAAVRRTFDLRDLHVYGGGLVMAAGFWTVHIAAACAVFGGLLVYLGLRR